MKRRRVLGDQPPERLVVFTEADWPGETRAERVTAWCAARKFWYLVNGWPEGFVVMLREQGVARRGSPGTVAVGQALSLADQGSKD